jgi:hypothetical protein
MGSLLHGNPGTEINFDDRAFLHLRSVVPAKRRRQRRPR